MTIVAAEKVEQKVIPLTAREIELVLFKASHRQVGVIFPVKRVGNNTTYTFTKAEDHEVIVQMNEGELMTVKMVSRLLRPFNQEYQTRFLAWVLTAHIKQAEPGGIYGHPENCLFETLKLKR